MELLEVFMNKLVHNPELRAIPAVYDFLKAPSQKDHSKQLKTENDQSKPPKSLLEFQTLTGVYDISDNPEAQNFCDGIQSFVKTHDALFKQFNDLNRKLIQDMIEVGKTIKQMAEVSGNISKTYQIAQTPDLELIYEKLKVQLDEWQKIVTKESKVLYSMFPKYFRYNQLESRSYQELFSNRIQTKAKADKSLKALNDKKEKLFQMKDYTKWGIRDDAKNIAALANDKDAAFARMLPKETEEIQNLLS